MVQELELFNLRLLHPHYFIICCTKRRPTRGGCREHRNPDRLDPISDYPSSCRILHDLFVLLGCGLLHLKKIWDAWETRQKLHSFQ